MAGKKGSGWIPIGPMADGETYKYDPVTDTWYDHEGPAYRIPYEYTAFGRKTQAMFHPETHKWTDQDGFILPTGISGEIDGEFRKQYKLNGQVKLLSLDDEPEDGPRKYDKTDIPGLVLKKTKEKEELQEIDTEELLQEARELRAAG